jgi:hypothetical protein
MTSEVNKKKLEEIKESVDSCIEGGITDESLTELKDNININMSSIPTTITVGQLEKLKNHINNRFNAFDANGELDLDQAQRNIAYSIGNWFNNYNGLLLKERQKLAEIEGELLQSKALAYDDIKMSKIKYDLDSAGTRVMLDGHKFVVPKNIERDKQKAYVHFLESAVKQIGYYANGVKIMLQREELKARYGQ